MQLSAQAKQEDFKRDSIYYEHGAGGTIVELTKAVLPTMQLLSAPDYHSRSDRMLSLATKQSGLLGGGYVGLWC